MNRSGGPGFIDLFAGCGGLGLGFKQAGFRPRLAVELDPDAAQTYRLNIDGDVVEADVRAVVEWPAAEVVVGGPPCQGFSLLGSRDPEDPRNELWTEFLRAVDHSGAPVFLLENVPQFLRSAEFERFARAARRRGFRVTSDVLCAADYGVPQMRHRAFVVGSLLGQPWLPRETHGPASPRRQAYKTVRDTFLEWPSLPHEPDGVNWHRHRAGVKPFSMRRYAAVPHDGGDRFDMREDLEANGLMHLVPPCWRSKRRVTTDVFGRLWWDRPAVTIRTEFKPEKGRYLHPVADRAITVREAARLQSFPDSFVFPETQKAVHVSRQIGNAVPPRLARALAGTVMEHLADHGYVAPTRTHDRRPGQLELDVTEA